MLASVLSLDFPVWLLVVVASAVPLIARIAMRILQSILVLRVKRIGFRIGRTEFELGQSSDSIEAWTRSLRDPAPERPSLRVRRIRRD